MNENQAVLRQSNGDYKVKSSGGGTSYTVEMFGPHAASCNCPHFLLGHQVCKHMRVAEEAEQQFQDTQQGVNSQPDLLFPDTELTRSAGFNLLKR